MRTKKPGFIAPLVPFTFVVGYLADMAWGNKMERIIGEGVSCVHCEWCVEVMSETGN